MTAYGLRAAIEDRAYAEAYRTGAPMSEPEPMTRERAANRLAEWATTWIGDTRQAIDIIRAWQAPDQRPDAVTISDAMVERGAKGLWYNAGYRNESWDPDDGELAPGYRSDARAVLEAALAPETPDGK